MGAYSRHTGFTLFEEFNFTTLWFTSWVEMLNADLAKDNKQALDHERTTSLREVNLITSGAIYTYKSLSVILSRIVQVHLRKCASKGEKLPDQKCMKEDDRH